MQQFYLLSCFFLFTFSYCCYAGNLHGKITDSVTHEELPGAILYITELQNGAVSGLDGSYSIDLKKGNYTLTISIISYKTITKNITVTSDSENIALNIFMVPENAVLKEVTVTAIITGSHDAGAREMEKRADNILNILSGRAIQLMPDVTVGNVLRRISGVTVDRGDDGEGKYPVIRGMDRRYNYTLVNGIKIPSPDDKARYVPMDIFPSEMLQQLEVIKTLTPDMEADATGGVMNLVMKDAPDKFLLDVQDAIGYSQYGFNNNFMSYPASSVQAQSPAEIYGPEYLATGNDFSKGNLNYSSGKALPDGQLGFTIGNRLYHKKLGVILSGSVQSTDRIVNDMYNEVQSQPAATAEGNQPLFTHIQTREYYTHSDRIGLHTKIDYQLNDKNEISVYGLVMQLNSYQIRTIIDTDLSGRQPNSNTAINYYYRSKTTLQNIYSTTLQGNHTLLQNLTLQWSGVVSLATEEQPDVAELDLTQTDSADHHLSLLYPSSVPTYWQHNQDRDLSGYVNLHYQFHLGSNQFDIGAGGMYRHKYRENYFNDYTELDAVNTTVPYTNINSTQFNFIDGNGATGTQLGDPDIYNVTENIGAVYTELRWTYKRWSALGGLRLENTYMNYIQPVVPVTVIGQTGTANYNNLFPSIDLKYKINDKSAMHISYFVSITRPDFFEVVPYVFPGEYQTEVGNPDLTPSMADNIDLRYELFPGKADQLLVGVFYKNIQDPIVYTIQRYVSDETELQPQNDTLSRAVNYGLEIVYSKYFSRFGVSFNYTYTNSSITNSEKVDYTNAAGQQTDEFINVSTPLQGQASNIGNISLLYKDPRPDKGFDLQLSAVYTGQFIYAMSPYNGENEWELPSLSLDFSGEKKISKHFAIYAKLNNLLNSPKTIVMYQNNIYLSDGVLTLPDQYTSNFLQFHQPGILGIFTSPNQTSSNMITVERAYFGQTYLLGLRYNF